MALPTIARSFASHMQTVAAIVDCNGTNDFMPEKGHGHYGVRKAYVETDDGEGVCMLTDETAGDVGSSLLKYETMCVSDACYDKLHEDELSAIQAAGNRRRLLRKCFCALIKNKE